MSRKKTSHGRLYNRVIVFVDGSQRKGTIYNARYHGRYWSGYLTEKGSRISYVRSTDKKVWVQAMDREHPSARMHIKERMPEKEPPRGFLNPDGSVSLRPEYGRKVSW